MAEPHTPTEAVEAFEALKTLVRARALLRSYGATTGTPWGRSYVDDHIKAVEAKFRAKCRPVIAGRR